MLEKLGNFRGGNWARPITLAAWSGLLLLLVLLLASCSKAPDAEISAAEVAIERASEVDAESYAVEELRAAEDSLAVARSEIDRQNAKFFLFRNYGTAKEKALAAEQAARQAADAAVANKDLRREEAERILADVQQKISDCREILEGPMGQRMMRAKGQRQDVEQIQADLNVIEANLDLVKENQLNERYADAARIAKERLIEVEKLHQELQSAVDKMTGGS
jgi:hypothetical protein